MQDDQLKQAKQAFPLQTLPIYQPTVRAAAKLQIKSYTIHIKGLQAGRDLQQDWKFSIIWRTRDQTPSGAFMIRSATRSGKVSLRTNVHKLKHNKLWRLGCDPWHLQAYLAKYWHS